MIKNCAADYCNSYRYNFFRNSLNLSFNKDFQVVKGLWITVIVISANGRSNE